MAVGLGLAVVGPILMGLSVEAKVEIDNSTVCQPGLLLPVWQPQIPLSGGERVARGTVYLLGMIYLFIGVSIVSDRFMNAIEMITSQEKTVKIKKKNGEMQDVKVRVWNETVANLTLMALGSSAPEILLSIIEIIAKDFKAGDLGPGTIVGSAAYNLFVIIALCVVVIPNGETRKIKQLRVFFITATWSIFAYIWLFLILRVFSEGVVDVWEGLLTFLFFPATVLTSYIADRRLFVFKYLPRISKDKEGEIEMGATENHIDLATRRAEPEGVGEIAESFEQKCREFTAIYQELRRQFPDEDKEALEIRAEKEILLKGPKSRAFYRMQATRKMVGGTDQMLRRLSYREKSEEREQTKEPDEDLNVQKVYFEKDNYKFMEDIGTAVVNVVRKGGNLNQRISVDYASEDGTAEAGLDYEPVSGTLVFEPGVTELPIEISIIDDEEFEEDETFIIRLSNLQLIDDTARRPSVPNRSGSRGSISSVKLQWQVQLGSPPFTTVTILDDDHGGIFRFANKEQTVAESVGLFQLKVVRYVGGKGKVSLPYSTEDGTARAGKEYEQTRGELIFENKEIEKTIPIKIIEEGAYEKNALFYVNLGEPKWIGEYAKAAEAVAAAEVSGDLTAKQELQLMAMPQLGNVAKAFVRICENKEFKMIIEKMAQNANSSVVQGGFSWWDQFKEAVTLREETDGEDEEPPSCGEYLMHFLTVFWKVIFALVPPTGYFNGWLCFYGSLFGIGVMTAIIGDVASHFGCSVGLKDSITAIGIVAMGTSLPDTFASKVAACQDDTADNSVGNVTGSNAVNVFLGIGVAWTIAAVYHAYHGEQFVVDPGSLAFSVTIFCSEAIVAIAILVLRRHPSVGGELGGPKFQKYLTMWVFLGLWVLYMTLSTLEVYGVIKGF